MFRPSARQQDMETTAREVMGLERDAWVDLARQADPRAVAATELTAIRVGAATALRCRVAGPVMNRAYDAPATTQLRALRSHYEEAHVPLYFLQVEASEQRDREVEAAGLVRYRRGMAYLWRATELPVAPVETALDLGPATQDEMLRGAEIFCAAFDVAGSLAPVIASLFGAPRWRFVIARANGEPVAFSMLYVDGDAACLFGGATSPRYRQRGAQAALVAARLELARELGCRFVGAHTGEPVEDAPQHSFRNLSRAGFQQIGRADTYVPGRES
jgi:GNAT superfamily N-acetyltransferase